MLDVVRLNSAFLNLVHNAERRDGNCEGLFVPLLLLARIRLIIKGKFWHVLLGSQAHKVVGDPAAGSTKQGVMLGVVNSHAVIIAKQGLLARYRLEWLLWGNVSAFCKSRLWLVI